MQVAQAKTVNDGKLAEPLRAPGNPASAAGKPFRGVVLFVAALLLFACMDTTTKFLSTHYDVPLVVAIRYIVHCLLMIVLLAPSQGRRLVQTRRTGLVLGGRGADALASVALPEHGRHRGTRSLPLHGRLSARAGFAAGPDELPAKLWAGLLGWLVFGHMPDHLSLVGMGVVAASGVLVAFKSRLPAPRLTSTGSADTYPAFRTVPNSLLALEKRP